MAVQIQIRNGTAAAWASANPTLAVGEMGAETDTGRFKIGTGSTAWNSLGYSLGVASKGAYSGATQYYVNDIVSYNNSSYICILASLGNLPTNTTYWNLLVLAGSVSSVGQTFTGGIISVSGSPVTGSGTLALTVAGTSGGVPYFSSGTAWASSAALAANALVIGGGAGAAPATTTTGTGVVTALGVNTGTAGAFVVNGGALGTPSTGTLTNATGLPISTGVSGLGTGVATFLGTPSSANLLSAITDETGTGLLMFNNTPSVTNPTVTNYTETRFATTVVTSPLALSLTDGTFQSITTKVGSNSLTLPSPSAGKSLTVQVVYASTPTSLAFTSPSGSLKYPGAVTPTATLTNGQSDFYSFISDGTNWYGVQTGANF